MDSPIRMLTLSRHMSLIRIKCSRIVTCWAAFQDTRAVVVLVLRVQLAKWGIIDSTQEEEEEVVDKPRILLCCLVYCLRFHGHASFHSSAIPFNLHVSVEQEKKNKKYKDV